MHYGIEDRTVLGSKNGEGGDKSQEGPLEDLEEGIECVEDSVDEENDNDRITLGLIGKLWTHRTPNPSAFIFMMKSIRVVKNGVDITNIGRNLYQFKFFHWRRRQKIVMGQPWLEDMDKVVKPLDIIMLKLPT